MKKNTKTVRHASSVNTISSDMADALYTRLVPYCFSPTEKLTRPPRVGDVLLWDGPYRKVQVMIIAPWDNQFLVVPYSPFRAPVCRQELNSIPYGVLQLWAGATVEARVLQTLPLLYSVEEDVTEEAFDAYRSQVLETCEPLDSVRRNVGCELDVEDKKLLRTYTAYRDAELRNLAELYALPEEEEAEEHTLKNGWFKLEPLAPEAGFDETKPAYVTIGAGTFMVQLTAGWRDLRLEVTAMNEADDLSGFQIQDSRGCLLIEPEQDRVSADEAGTHVAHSPMVRKYEKIIGDSTDFEFRIVDSNGFGVTLELADPRPRALQKLDLSWSLNIRRPGKYELLNGGVITAEWNNCVWTIHLDAKARAALKGKLLITDEWHSYVRVGRAATYSLKEEEPFRLLFISGENPIRLLE